MLEVAAGFLSKYSSAASLCELTRYISIFETSFVQCVLKEVLPLSSFWESTHKDKHFLCICSSNYGTYLR